MKKILAPIILGFWAVSSGCNNPKNVNNTKQEQIIKECHQRIKKQKKKYPEDKSKMSCDEKGNIIYELPQDHSLVKYLNRLKQDRVDLEFLIKKYGDEKIIDGRKVIYWEFNWAEVNNTNSKNTIKYFYTLYNNGTVRWIRTEIKKGKECLQEYATITNPPGLGIKCISKDPCRGFEEEVLEGRYCSLRQKQAIENARWYDNKKDVLSNY